MKHIDMFVCSPLIAEDLAQYNEGLIKYCRFISQEHATIDFLAICNPVEGFPNRVLTKGLSDVENCVCSASLSLLKYTALSKLERFILTNSDRSLWSNDNSIHTLVFKKGLCFSATIYKGKDEVLPKIVR